MRQAAGTASARPGTRPDYVGEDKSKYEIWQVLGWPYETSVAMARMVFSGFYEKLPDLRLITHHCGAMIPFFAGRAETLWAQLGSRTAGENYEEILKRMAKKPIEYFKMFYADTVLGGAELKGRSQALEYTLPRRIIGVGANRARFRLLTLLVDGGGNIARIETSAARP